MRIQRPQPPFEATAWLNDPRLQPSERGDGTLGLTALPPTIRPLRGASRYVLLDVNPTQAQAGPDHWSNAPLHSVHWGSGHGFPGTTERPRLEMPDAALPSGTHVFRFSNWLISAPEVVRILRGFEPDSIDTLAITCGDPDHTSQELVFLDVRRLIDAYDYRGCEVLVQTTEHGRFIAGLGSERALRTDICLSIHLFRDSFQPRDLFVSREVARALVVHRVRGVEFRDPADLQLADL